MVSAATSSPWSRRENVIYRVFFAESSARGNVCWLPKDFRLARRGGDIRRRGARVGLEDGAKRGRCHGRCAGACDWGESQGITPMSDLASISGSLAGRRARLFSISECTSEREGAGGVEEGGRRMGRVSTGRIKYLLSVYAGPLAVVGSIMIPIYLPRLCPRSHVPTISSLLTSNHVQRRFLQPKQRSP